MSKITRTDVRHNEIENTTSVSFFIQDCSFEFHDFVMNTLSNELNCVPMSSNRRVICMKENTMIDTHAIYCVVTDDDATINAVIVKIADNSNL